MTNYEKIKSMTIDELAEFLCSTSSSIAIKMFGDYVPTHTPYMKKYLECSTDENWVLVENRLVEEMLLKGDTE